MAGVGDALECTLQTHSAMSAIVSILVLVAVLPVSQASSDYTICPPYKNEIKLFPFDTVYFGTNSTSVNVSVFAPDCVNEKQVLKLVEFKESNETSQNEESDVGMKWYEFNYCGNKVARIGSIMTKFEQNASLSSESACRDEPVTLSMNHGVVLAKKCDDGVDTDTRMACMEQIKGVTDTDTPQELHINPRSEMIWKILDELNPNSSQGLEPLDPSVESREQSIFEDSIPKLFDSLRNVDSRGPLLDTMNWPKKYDDILDSITVTPPSYNLHDKTYFGGDSSLPKTRHYKENAIPIFIGIVVFSVSMCLRFCLCRAKSVVSRVTTVTVIRNVEGDSIQDFQQDPPPSYVDVVSNATPQDGDSEPPPPAYADIIDEVNLPTYSEVEAQNMPVCEEVPLAEQDTQGTNAAHPPCDPDSAPPDGKGSPPATKNALTKYRSQQKQFSFKVLDEDE